MPEQIAPLPKEPAGALCCVLRFNLARHSAVFPLQWQHTPTVRHTATPGIQNRAALGSRASLHGWVPWETAGWPVEARHPVSSGETFLRDPLPGGLVNQLFRNLSCLPEAWEFNPFIAGACRECAWAPHHTPRCLPGADCVRDKHVFPPIPTPYWSWRFVPRLLWMVFA